MAFVKAALFVVVLGAWASTAQAQDWTPVGPPGGDVRSLVQDPEDAGRIYLGTSRGILYRSDDGGLSWERMPASPALSGSSLDELAVDSEGALWVGYWEVQSTGGGVARSTDGGRSFNVFMRGESVRALAI